MSRRAPTDHPVQDVVAERWSPYCFGDGTVPRETLRSLFEAVRWAPSSYNEQPWSYLIARREDPEPFERLLSCLVEGNRAWARFAAVLALGVVARRFARDGQPNRAAEHDLGLAAGNLLVEATARGLAVHQMIGILPERARELYAIPEDHEALTALAIGYHGERPELPERLRARDEKPRTRRPLGGFVFEERFGRTAPSLAGGDGAD